MRHDFRFPRAARLRRKRDFEAVFDRGVCIRIFPLVIRALEQPEAPDSRLGLAVSRRAGNACRRNRIKRLIREAFRLNRHRLHIPHDIVVSVMRTDEQFGFHDVEQAIREAFERLNALPGSASGDSG